MSPGSTSSWPTDCLSLISLALVSIIYSRDAKSWKWSCSKALPWLSTPDACSYWSPHALCIWPCRAVTPNLCHLSQPQVGAVAGHPQPMSFIAISLLFPPVGVLLLLRAYHFGGRNSFPVCIQHHSLWMGLLPWHTVTYTFLRQTTA